MMSLLKLESRKRGSNIMMAKKIRQSLNLRGGHLQSTTVDRILQFVVDVAGAMGLRHCPLDTNACFICRRHGHSFKACFHRLSQQG